MNREKVFKINICVPKETLVKVGVESNDRKRGWWGLGRTAKCACLSV